MIDIEIDTTDLENAWLDGLYVFQQDLAKGVARAADEGAKAAVNGRIYEDRTGNLTGSIQGGEAILTPNYGAESEIIAIGSPRRQYASYVQEWEESERGIGFMDIAAEKAEHVLEASVEVAVAVLEHNVNRR